MGDEPLDGLTDDDPFAMEEGEAVVPAPSADAGDGAPPVPEDRPVVALPGRRRRWSGALVPPLLILICAGGVIGYRLQTRDWAGVSWVRGLRSGVGRGTRSTTTSATTSPMAAPGGIAVRIKAAPKPEAPTVLAAAPLPVPPKRRERKDEASPPRPPPAPAAVVEPDPAPIPIEPPPPEQLARDSESIRFDIDRTAAEINRERETLQVEKRRQLDKDQREAKDRQRRQVADFRKTRDEERVVFRDELRRLLAAKGGKKAAEIEQLCARYGRDAPPAVMEQVYRARLSRVPYMSQNAEIELYRRLGIPETLILDFLTKKQIYRVGTTSGPRDRDEARVLAARLLLRVPIGADGKAPPPPTPPGRVKGRPAPAAR